MSLKDRIKGLLSITGLDLSNGQRNVKPMEEAAKAMKIENLSELAEAFGGLQELPADFETVRGLDINKGRIAGDTAAVVDLNPTFKFKGLGKDEEIRQIPFSAVGGRNPQYEIVKKRAPYAGLPRIGAGIFDRITGNIFDLDARGKVGDGIKLVDINDPKNYLVSQAQKSKVVDALEQAGVDTGQTDKNPMGDAETQLSFLEKNADRLNKLYRQMGRASAFDNFVNYALTEPIRLKNIEKARAAAVNQDLQAALEMQGTPNQIQLRQDLARTGFANELNAISNVQDAATRMAGVGVNPRNVSFSA